MARWRHLLGEAALQSEADVRPLRPELQQLKGRVFDFWNEKSCGEDAYAHGASLKEQLESQARSRQELEPEIPKFAGLEAAQGKDVLEIGVGMGAEHEMLARQNPRSLSGIDLTPRAIEFTSKRLALYGLQSNLRVADAENLPFEDESFDFVFSYGVMHHSPDTQQAVNEAWRVLRPGGLARIMIYHRYSMVGYMLWTRYALLRGRPFRSLSDIYAQHLESPGTKAFTLSEAMRMFSKFSAVSLKVELGPGDLLIGGVGQRHKGVLLSLVKSLYPRWFVRRFLSNHGLGLLIEATK
jgi:ubiquinone/menaquinone biosynthesis C-methylase UbiE